MSVYPVDAVDSIDAVCLPFDREPSERVQIDPTQSTVFGRLQVYLWHRIFADPSITVRPKCLQPSRRTQTPLAAACEAGGPEIVALGGRKIQKLLRDHTGDRMVAEIRRGGPTVPISMETCDGTVGEEGKRSIEDWLNSVRQQYNLSRCNNAFVVFGYRDLTIQWARHVALSWHLCT